MTRRLPEPETWSREYRERIQSSPRDAVRRVSDASRRVRDPPHGELRERRASRRYVTFQTRVPGNRNRDCSAIREVDDQGVFSYVNLFGLDRSEVSL